MNVSLAAGFRPVHSPFLERRFLLRQGAGASGADRDAPVNEAGHRSPLPDTASTAHERPSPCNEFIVTVDVWQLHQFRWPIMGALAPGYIEQTRAQPLSQATACHRPLARCPGRAALRCRPLLSTSV